jgi:hypothetical protein
MPLQKVKKQTPDNKKSNVKVNTVYGTIFMVAEVGCARTLNLVWKYLADFAPTFKLPSS